MLMVSLSLYTSSSFFVILLSFLHPVLIVPFLVARVPNITILTCPCRNLLPPLQLLILLCFTAPFSRFCCWPSSASSSLSETGSNKPLH
jgi:hypothetical protein